MEFVLSVPLAIQEPIATNAYPVVPASVAQPYNAPQIASPISTIPPSALVSAHLDGQKAPPEIALFVHLVIPEPIATNVYPVGPD